LTVVSQSTSLLLQYAKSPLSPFRARRHTSSCQALLDMSSSTFFALLFLFSFAEVLGRPFPIQAISRPALLCASFPLRQMRGFFPSSVVAFFPFSLFLGHYSKHLGPPSLSFSVDCLVFFFYACRASLLSLPPLIARRRRRVVLSPSRNSLFFVDFSFSPVL